MFTENLLQHVFLLPLVLLATSSVTTTATLDRPPCSHEYCEKQNAIFEWVETNGGYVNPMVELTTGPDPSWKIRGVFATLGSISVDATVFSIPSKLMLCRTHFCDLVAALSQEISLGKASFWWPYLSTLEDHKIDLPCVWSDEERDLLSGLYPDALVTETAHDLCNMTDLSNESMVRSFQLVSSRFFGGENDGKGHVCMIPLFDAINQAQPSFENVNWNGNITENLEFKVVMDIAVNEQLLESYTDNTFNRLFQNYGFLSRYPQLWVFPDEDSEEELKFQITEENEGVYSFDFNPQNEGHQNDLDYMNEAIYNHLSSVLESEPPGIALKSPTVNNKRYETALAFRQEYIKAFQTALEYIQTRIDENYDEDIAEEDFDNNADDTVTEGDGEDFDESDEEFENYDERISEEDFEEYEDFKVTESDEEDYDGSEDLEEEIESEL